MLKKLVVLMLLGSGAWACEKNWIDGPAGPCTAYMPRSLGASEAEQAKWVSDEKPPNDKMPSYQREGVKTVDAPNMTESDRAFDESKARELATVTTLPAPIQVTSDAGKRP